MRAIEKFDDLEFEQQCELLKVNGKNWPISDDVKNELWGYLTNSLPHSTPIKSSHEINIGDTFIYIGNPRGLGMYVPKVGQQFEIKNQDDVIRMSIEMIERGRGYQKLIDSTKQP